MNPHVLSIASTAALLFLGLIWSKHGWYNLILKVALFGLGVLDVIALVKAS